jgi:hypothetical protein
MDVQSNTAATSPKYFLYVKAKIHLLSIVDSHVS